MTTKAKRAVQRDGVTASKDQRRCLFFEKAQAEESDAKQGAAPTVSCRWLRCGSMDARCNHAIVATAGQRSVILLYVHRRKDRWLSAAQEAAPIV